MENHDTYSNHDNHQPSPRRETMLTVVLTGLGFGGFLTFLILVSGGFFFYVLLAVAAITAMGYFHYLAWGFSMTQEVEEEQAHEAALRRAQIEENPSVNRVRHRRF